MTAVQKKILVFLIFHLFAGAAVAGEAAHIDAGRMRSGTHKGRKAREFSGAVVLGRQDCVLHCDTLVLYEDGSWSAEGSIVLALPGMRIDAQSGNFERGGLAVFSGSAFIFSNAIKIDFKRFSFTEPRRCILEDAVLYLDGREKEQNFPVLALVFSEESLQINLPNEEIRLANASAGEELCASILSAIQKSISGYVCAAGGGVGK